MLLPSELESFGLAALEAMACEVVPIATNAGGVPEVIDHGKTGFLAEVGDVDTMANYAIDMLSDEKKLKQMGEQARGQRAGKILRQQNHSACMKDIYRAVLESLFVDRAHDRAAHVVRIQHRQHQPHQGAAIGLALDRHIGSVTVHHLQPLRDILPCRYRFLKVPCAVRRNTHAVIFHLDHQALIGAAAAQINAAALNFVREAVLDGVLHQRLQNHAGHQMIERCRLQFLHDSQLVVAKARDLDIEIVVEKFQLLAQRNERIALAQQAAQNVAQLHDHLARGIGIGTHQRGNRIQRVEQEVRIDLALQRFHARLQQQPLLLLQLHLDAHVVQHLQRDGDGHHRARIDGELHPNIG